jgi:hypothetical protein
MALEHRYVSTARYWGRTSGEEIWAKARPCIIAERNIRTDPLPQNHLEKITIPTILLSYLELKTNN